MLKAVVAGTTFLWKKPESNPVLAKIAEHHQEELHTYLTAEDTMLLYKDSLVDSEVAYGTLVEEISDRDGWSKVIVLDQPSNNHEKGYPGFIPTSDLMLVTEMYAQVEEKVAVISPQAELTFTDYGRQLAFGTVLPLEAEEKDSYSVHTPQGLASISKESTQKVNQYPAQDRPQRMIELAEQFMDMPYVWSGTTGCGFDCSGFMYALHRVNGIIIPRDTPEQSENGRHVKYKNALPGDLLLFAYEEGKGTVHHVGMYLGEDEMIHSQTPGSKVMKTKIHGSKYEPELAVVSRYWK